MQKQSLNTVRKVNFLESASKSQQSNAVSGNNLCGFVWHCHGNPTVPQPPLPSSWNEPDCGTDPDVNTNFLVDEERWCLLLLKGSHSHRRHSATVISLEKLLLRAGWLQLSQGQLSAGSGKHQLRHKESHGLGAGHWNCSLGLLLCLTEHISRNMAVVLLMFRLPKSL